MPGSKCKFRFSQGLRDKIFRGLIGAFLEPQAVILNFSSLYVIFLHPEIIHNMCSNALSLHNKYLKVVC